MVALGGGGVFVESGGLSHGFGEVFCEIANMAAGFLGAAQDAFDVHLCPKSDHVRGLSEIRAGLFPAW
jgi:hypothetical protein